MRIFKFGGASVKDANGVRNLVKVLKHEGITNTLVVISAMGKMTNAFEIVVNSYFNKENELKSSIETIHKFHIKIVEDLFEKEDKIHQDLHKLFESLNEFLIQNTSKDYNYIYDQIVHFGELLSTKIISAFIEKSEIINTWLDIRTIIKTDSEYRNAAVNWNETQTNCSNLSKEKLHITQGFIARDSKNNTTTLGREGSDYSAGILAYCLGAESVTIWKDVDGVLEAIEMAFYGASVIHPKTIKPLENKKIPLYVRSFENLENNGTKVSKGVDLHPKTSCYIVKKKQILVSISTNDFSFMVEENLSKIFKQLHQHKLKVNLIQNSAISFSVCLEDSFANFNRFYDEIHANFKIKYK